MFVIIVCVKGSITGGEVVRWYDTYDEAVEGAKAVADKYPTKSVGIYSWVNNIV